MDDDIIFPTVKPGWDSSAYFIVLGSAAALTVYFLWKAKPWATNADVPPEAKSFQRYFYFAWFFAVTADWLQGPYIYVVLEEHGFGHAEIGYIFSVGFMTSLFAGFFVGPLADFAGRKLCCVLYCAIYALCCMCIHFRSIKILYASRVAGGIATSLLYSVFETWMVSEHKRNKWSEELLQYHCVLMTLVNFSSAVVTGLFSEFAVGFVGDRIIGESTMHFGGHLTPFATAVVCLVLAGMCIQCTWKENYGEKEQRLNVETGFVKGMWSTLLIGVRAIGDPRVALIGVALSLFEGSMFVFVFNKTPQLQVEGADPPLGIIFACLMLMVVCGSMFFEIGTAQWNISVTKLLVGILMLSSFSFFLVAILPPLADNGLLFLASFMIFEFCVGAYYPSIYTLKGAVVPECSRATVYNLFRVPMNALVLIVLCIDLSLYACWMTLGLFLFAAAVSIVIVGILNISSSAATSSEHASFLMAVQKFFGSSNKFEALNSSPQRIGKDVEEGLEAIEMAESTTDQAAMLPAE